MAEVLTLRDGLMLAPGHIAVGVVIGAGTLWAGQAAGLHPTSGAAVGWVTLVGGFALAPDIDTRKSAVSKLLFPVRWVWLLARLVLRTAVGHERADYWMAHRRITHTPVAACVVAVAGLGACWVWQWPLWAGAAAGVGWAAHIAGDLPTLSGVPLALPWSDREWAGRWFRVGGRVELAVVTPGLWVAACWLGWHCLGSVAA